MTSPKLNTAAEVEAALERLWRIGHDGPSDGGVILTALDAERSAIIAAVVAEIGAARARAFTEARFRAEDGRDHMGDAVLWVKQRKDLQEQLAAAREALRVERVVAAAARELVARLDRLCPEWRDATLDGPPENDDEVNAAWRSLTSALAPTPPPESAVPPAGEGEATRKAQR